MKLGCFSFPNITAEQRVNILKEKWNDFDLKPYTLTTTNSMKSCWEEMVKLKQDFPELEINGLKSYYINL